MTETSAAEPTAPPLSVAQEALWYTGRLAPAQITYNEIISIRKEGPFDAPAFRRAFEGICRRHEAWRTTFDTVDGEPVQVVHPVPGFDLRVLDLSDLSGEEAERRAVGLIAEVARVPYDIRRGPLLRPRLVRFPGEQHRLYLALHHLVFDGVSVNRVVLPELVALYDAFRGGRPSPLDPLRAQYADYARWEQRWITEPRVARRLEHWRRRLAGAPLLALPLDRPRPESPGLRGSMLSVSIPDETVSRLRELGRESGATLFQVLATIWAMLLGRYSGQRELVFATVADLRQRPELISVVGYAVTPVVLRVDLGGEPSVAELVVRVRNELLDALDNLVPFERVVRELHAGGTSSGNPIYQTMLVLEPTMVTPDPAWSMHQLESGVGSAIGNTKVDLELQLEERPEGHIVGRLIYDRDLFDPATARRLTEHWRRLAAGAATDPGAPAAAIPMLTPTEERQQTVEFNATATERSPHSVPGLVRETATRAPDALAVGAGGQAISYRDLRRRAAWVARRLLEAGVARGDVVAVCAQPSLDLVVGALGILEAGAAYLLIDPGLPAWQRAFMLADAGVAAVLAGPIVAGGPAAPGVRVLRLDEAAAEARLGPALAESVDPEATCLVQFAGDGRDQGQGVPPGQGQGVPLSHGSVVNLARALAAELSVGPADTFLVLPSTILGCSAVELWLPLIAGARIVVAPDETAGDGARLTRLMAAEGVTFLHASPSAWQALIETGLRPVRGLRALSGGEPLSAELAEQILARCRVLWNAYGTAETTAYCTLGRVEPSAPVTIGRPITNTRTYVLDGLGQPVPVGVPGELVVAGAAVAAGYLNRPELTAAAFVAEPAGTGAAYRTGRRARWLVDGRLELVAPSRR